MFTGIISAIGTIKSVTPAGDAARVVVDAGKLDLSDVALGDSVAISGVCLTVVDLKSSQLAFDVSKETLDCTIGFNTGAPVNLEKALRLSDRLGGHLVSGHVDGVGTVTRFDAVGEDKLLEIEAPRSLAQYIARKGSIAVNGVSLTVNAVNDCKFTINLIPHTLKETNLHTLKAGVRVNLEVDMLARYAERLSEFK